MTTQSPEDPFSPTAVVPVPIRLSALLVGLGGSAEILGGLAAPHPLLGSVEIWIVLTLSVAICLYQGQRWAKSVLWLVGFLTFFIFAVDVSIGIGELPFSVIAFVLTVSALVAVRRSASRNYFEWRYAKKF